MADIFDKITRKYLKDASSPLSLQRDYGSHVGADFLASEDDLYEDDVYEDDLYEDDLYEDDVYEDDVYEDDLYEDDESDTYSSRYASHREPAYMSRQNLRQMLDQIITICESIGEDELEGWVEDKISHAHAALTDVSRYMKYHRHESHDLLNGFDRVAEDDDERMAYRKWTKEEWEEHKEKYPEMAYYEGAYNKGKFSPERANKNIKKYKLEDDMSKGRFKPRKAGWR